MTARQRCQNSGKAKKIPKRPAAVAPDFSNLQKPPRRHVRGRARFGAAARRCEIGKNELKSVFLVYFRRKRAN